MNIMLRNLILVGILCCFCQYALGRKHKPVIKDDRRPYIPLSSFGFYKGGILDVKLKDFKISGDVTDDDLFGFTLDRKLNEGHMNLENHQDHCMLKDSANYNPATVYFYMDRKNKILKVNCSSDLMSLNIFGNSNDIPRNKRDKLSDHSLFASRKLPVSDSRVTRNTEPPCKLSSIPLIKSPNGYKANFVILVETDNEEGLYNLYFHNCPRYDRKNVAVDFVMEIEESNRGNYLSAGDMPLPALYFMMSVLFFLSGCFWVFILVKSKHPVFKIHYLMAILVYLKSLSLLFHAINYHFIETKGEHVAAWAILYYITHLLKGSVLFITIVLIGTGWTFIKHLLSEKDKKIFMVVIPLQVLANVAKIIIEESEEGDAEHKTWLDVFMLVDLLCCGAILFPVVWSIRHLQEASQTDGKAAINLRKLKLFRHFYIMIVCYIYFTRIIVFLLQMTVSFQYKWLDEMFREMVTFVFFVMTGYKFRPASANPYFQVNTEEDDDDEMDIVVTQCGLTEGLSKLSRLHNKEEKDDDKEILLVSNRESSHEYD